MYSNSSSIHDRKMAATADSPFKFPCLFLIYPKSQFHRYTHLNSILQVKAACTIHSKSTIKVNNSSFQTVTIQIGLYVSSQLDHNTRTKVSRFIDKYRVQIRYTIEPKYLSNSKIPEKKSRFSHNAFCSFICLCVGAIQNATY